MTALRVRPPVVAESGCWIWQGAKNPGGYGRIGASGDRRAMSAHRFYWEREHGPVPQGLELDHLCRVRDCVNPAHMEPVTRTENMRRSSATKLTEEKAAFIRILHRVCGVRKRPLAKMFGISESLSGLVVNGKAWATPEMAPIDRIASDIHHAEVLLASLITERDNRRASK